MSVVKIREGKFKKSSLDKISTMAEIVADYQRQGLRLTARQLYYQLVSKNIITNTENSYKSTTALLVEARYAGLIDWYAIEDRGRAPSIWRSYDSVKDCVEDAMYSYRLARWEDQPNYVELWVEKQALAGVLEPLAAEFHTTLSVNKGYSSATAMYDASRRFLTRQRKGKELGLFYLGDHDPSGEDMVRDIGDRLAEFGVRDLQLTKVALTMAQIEEYDPPPNPAKVTDSRFAKYAEAHGESSWEVDALPPPVLQQLVRDALEGSLDRPLWDAVLRREEEHKARLLQAAEAIGDD